MNVEFTRAAEMALERIGDFIAMRNPRAAISFLRELRESCLALSDMPERHPLVRGREAQGLQRCVHGSYLIFYRVDRASIIIVHVLHGAMDYDAILFSTD